MDSVDFQVALGAVKHFGKNLYTSNPPAIAELIANAWDAYAKKCQIVVVDNEMVIIDDGIGMTDEELADRYAKSGFEKNPNVRKPSDMDPRAFMGKKGIGKFSAFSLSDSYTIATKSEQDQDWKKSLWTMISFIRTRWSIKLRLSRFRILRYFYPKPLIGLNCQQNQAPSLSFQI